jgi:LacI family transcriptional regulator
MQKSSQATIKDIAKKLQISVSTVSRALKDHPDISMETKQLVKSTAEELNYRPNILALSLRKQKTYTIGLIIPAIVHHFFSSVISGIEDLAFKEGYNLIICQSNENQHREAINLQTLIDHRVDGILASVSKTTLNFSHFNKALENKIPLVFFDRVAADINTDKVVTDDITGGFIATEYLIKKRKCRNILHLSASQNLAIGRDRCEGYTQALLKYKIPLRDELILKCDTNEEVKSLRKHLLNLAPKIDGIFAVNDSTAIAAMQVLQDAGFSVPGDVAVMGFGDGPNAVIVKPALTTVIQKGYDMGYEATRLLLQRLNNPSADINPQTITFKPTLKIRDSA